MESKKEIIYEKSIELLVNSRKRFTIDDLSIELHMAKKTIYKEFPSRKNLEDFIYDYSFALLEMNIKNVSPSCELKNDIFMIFSNILVICDKNIFSIYEIENNDISSINKKFLISEASFFNYLNNTNLKPYLDNKGFTYSLEASLKSINRNKNNKELLKSYIKFLESI